jgi:hypothetical protein
MFLAIKRFSGIKNTEMVTKKIENELVPKIRDLPGFVAYYAVKFDNGDHGPVAIFQTKENLENAIRHGETWLKQNLPNEVPTNPELLKGEVLFSAAGKTLAKSA